MKDGRDRLRMDIGFLIVVVLWSDQTPYVPSMSGEAGNELIQAIRA